ncbi:MAG: hypothetical protein QXH92_04220 [Candidatus Aenigmatarchaeota archaeon]
MYSSTKEIKIVKPFILKLAYFDTGYFYSSSAASEPPLMSPDRVLPKFDDKVGKTSKPLGFKTLTSTSLAIALPFFLSQLFTNLYSQPTIDSVQILNTIKNLYNQPSRDPFKDVFAALLRQLNSATQ